MICRSENLVERLLVESCIIKKCNVMNLNEGLYKIDSLLAKNLQASVGVKRALLICNNG